MKRFIPSYPDEETGPPKYEEYAKSPRPTTEKQPVIPVARQQRRIQTLITESISPHLTSNAIDGIHHSIFILIASNAITSSSPSLTLVTKPTLPTTIIQLTDHENRAETWSPRVVADLQQELQLTLGPPPRNQNQNPVPEPPQIPPRPLQTSWLKRTFGTPDPEHDPTGSTGQWQLGWKTEEEQVQRIRSRPLNPAEVELSVRLKEVAFRSESALGLLVTDTVKCIWIEIEVGEG